MLREYGTRVRGVGRNNNRCVDRNITISYTNVKI